MNKRIVMTVGSLLLAGVLSSSVLAVEEADVAGSWYLNLVQIDEEEFNPAVMGFSMELNLNDDGTAMMIGSDNESAGTWSVEGDQVIILAEGDEEPAVFTYTEGNLIANEDDTVMTFGREPDEGELFVPGDVEKYPSMDQFEGYWTMSIVEMLDMQMPASLADIDMSLDIHGGKAVLYYNDGISEAEGELTATLDGDTLYLVNEEYTEDEDEFYMLFNPNMLELKLHKSGVLSYSNKELVDDELETEEFLEEIEYQTEAYDGDEADEDLSFAVYFEK